MDKFRNNQFMRFQSASLLEQSEEISLCSILPGTWLLPLFSASTLLCIHYLTIRYVVNLMVIFNYGISPCLYSNCLNFT